MKIEVAVLMLFACLVFLACKKEEKQTTVVTNPNAPAPSPPATSSATVFSGIFSATSYTSYGVGSSVPVITMYANAYFSSVPQQNINSSTAVNVNSVYLNQDSLTYFSGSGYYMTPGTSSLNLATETWSVNGANGIANFSFINTSQIPKTTSNLFSALPATISLSSGFTVNINGISNITSAVLLVYDGSFILQKPLVQGNNNIPVTPLDLSSTSTTTSGVVTVLLESKKAYVFSNKDYKFWRTEQFAKGVVIVP